VKDMCYEVRRAEACVCPSRTSEREGEGYLCERRSVNPIPNPDPKMVRIPVAENITVFRVS